MKIRTGFVSNSSSSSFCIFYDDVKFPAIKKSDVVDGKICFTNSSFCNEGVLLATLSPEVWEYIKKNKEDEKIQKFLKSNHFLNVLRNTEEGDRNCVVETGDVGKKIWAETFDQYSPGNDIESFKQFIEEEE